MNIITRIRFPRASETSNLYMRCSEGSLLNFSQEQVEVAFTKKSILSLNTYFNSFYEKFYVKYTALKDLYYLLKLDGDFQISLYREYYNGESRDLIYTANFEKCLLSKPIKVILPDSWRSENAGRHYLEIICLSEKGLFVKGCIATEQPKLHEVSLALITCTFKKEAYVKNTVNTVLKDDLLQKENFKFFIVDNGRTLKEDEFPEPRVQLIPNRNFGGAGGFTRGLIQAIDENLYTHFLFMDDDVEIDSESIYRLFVLYEYANQDFAVAGSMLDLYKKYLVHEAGALYCKYIDTNGNYKDDMSKGLSLKHKLNIENPSNINILLAEDIPDYGAFWFFSFSQSVIKDMGLPMPFFIKEDDIEFGLRIRERLGKMIVVFPGISIWHEPFYAKSSGWINYYSVRNRLITNSMRSLFGYVDTIKFLTKSLLYSLLVFDYNSAEMLLKGFEDYIEGPTVIENNDPEILHSKILELSKIHKTQSTKTTSSNTVHTLKEQGNENHSQLVIKRIIGLLTLNGHFLPNFLLSNEDVMYWMGSDYFDNWHKVFPNKRVVIVREGNSSVEKYEMDRKSCIKILINWLKIIILLSIRWTSVRTEWRNAFNRFTSTKFWKKYLKLDDQELLLTKHYNNASLNTK
ncbi:glycosyl transferase family 2 [Nostoc sp. T09]|uniref:glycosyltransferase family 2 protein n=1 Tax=Nostoc sp. T09 TaxID=1932621 RepID=UPI000A387D85|nr:glycosyltransferase [Nostoc sp. T09]OUL36830.1 glycosyl transferase family 2 [Nostoc sp. T09]